MVDTRVLLHAALIVIGTLQARMWPFRDLVISAFQIIRGNAGGFSGFSHCRLCMHC